MFKNMRQNLAVANDTDLSHQFRSTLGKSLYQVFGVTQQVKDFDHHHMTFKSSFAEKSGEICKHLITIFVPRLEAAYTSSTEAVKLWQNAFYEKHMFLPKSDDLDEKCLKQHTIMKHAKSLLNHFKNYGHI